MKNDWTAKANNFDFIRLALAVLVIYSHSFPLGTGSEASEPIRIFTRGQMTGGAIAVDLFFIMSGFLISASAERSSGILSYLQKRVARIYPAFIVSAVLTATLVVPFISAHIAGASPITRFGDFFLQTLRLREFDYTGAFPTNPYPIAINGSVWSIQYEFWCYLGVALLLSVGLLRKRAVLLSLFFASVGVSVAFQVEGWIFGGKWLGILMGSPQLWVRLLPLYLAGVVFYLYRDKIRSNPWAAVASAIALCIAARIPCGCAALFPIAGAYLVFYLAFAPQLNLRRAGRFGDFSYGTYLYAFPIMQLLMRSIGHPVAPLFLFACATPLTLLAAIASWYGVERRFLRPGRRKETFEAAIDTRPTPAARLKRA
jgi:peptidoglycan/LPS O-acetylase OafA/YrhL